MPSGQRPRPRDERNISYFKKAENKIQAAETEAEKEWVRVDSEGNPLADQAPTAEELEAKLAAANRGHTETLGDAWAVLTGQNPAAIMGQIATTPSWRRRHRYGLLLAVET